MNRKRNRPVQQVSRLVGGCHSNGFCFVDYIIIVDGNLLFNRFFDYTDDRDK
jgi:hypothetical protein